jgi:glutamyl-Q tRNA(Asp) synthetase
MTPPPQAGRFAPSPTGPLHSGSLLAAVGSYLDARTSGARWLVRIEDIDTPRVVAGCADDQLRTLERLGFEWDGEVLYQSARFDAYRATLAQLAAAGRTFRCSCTRKELAADGAEAGGYPGTCRTGPTKTGAASLRFRVSDREMRYDDLYQGTQRFDLAALGDFTVERRDGLPSYQLAVVVDDAHQSITRVIRGADLLASTPWQRELQDALGVATPIYGHLPLVTEPGGAKLSKSTRALPLDPSAASRDLTATLTLLSQQPPLELAQTHVKEVWKWALGHWRPQAFAGRTTATLSATGDS